MIANTPKPPYYAVIFSNILHNNQDKSYHDMADKMSLLAQQQEGYLGAESVRDELGITVSYWRDVTSILAWKNNLDHLEAQEKGKSTWYQKYKIRIAKVERDYGIDI